MGKRDASDRPILRLVMRYTVLVLATILLLRVDVIAKAGQRVEQQTRDYYAHWIGVQAPDFAHPLSERQDDGPELRLRNYQGKRLFLTRRSRNQEFMVKLGDERESQCHD